MWQILTSGEFWAAGFGAAAAFMLEALRQWRARIKAEQAHANVAIATLAQMYTYLSNIWQQTFEERTAEIKKLLGRDPLPIEYLPLAMPTDHGLRLDLSSLGMLARTHDPDLINRLAVVERCFVSDIAHEQHRARLHVVIQQRFAQSGTSPEAVMRHEEFQRVVGFDLAKQLDSVTQAQLDGIPKTRELILKIQAQLSDAARLHYPTGRFIKFEPTEPTDADLRVPGSAALWRRGLRWLVDRLRRKSRYKVPRNDG